MRCLGYRTLFFVQVQPCMGRNIPKSSFAAKTMGGSPKGRTVNSSRRTVGDEGRPLFGSSTSKTNWVLSWMGNGSAIPQTDPAWLWDPLAMFHPPYCTSVAQHDVCSTGWAQPASTGNPQHFAPVSTVVPPPVDIQETEAAGRPSHPHLVWHRVERGDLDPRAVHICSWAAEGYPQCI